MQSVSFSLTDFSVLGRVSLLSEEALPEEAAGPGEEERARLQLVPHVLRQRADVVLEEEARCDDDSVFRVPKS